MSEDLELNDLAASFAEFLHAEWPREKAVAFDRSGEPFDAALWAAVSDLGWAGLMVPETRGGLGLGTSASAYLHSALGTAAAPVPMLGTLLGGILLNIAEAGAAAEVLLPQIATGSRRIAFAEPGSCATSTDGRTVTGSVRDLLDAPSANLFIIHAAYEGRPCWLLIDASADGVVLECQPLGDRTRSFGDLRLDATPLGSGHLIFPDDPDSLDAMLLRQACVAIAADSLGIGEAVLAGTIDYMKTREQFGRTIGSFQALKHRIADHQTALVGARGLVVDAASLAEDSPEILLAAMSTKAHVTRVAAEVARDCIQLCGGVGFTSEYFPHIYLKRAKLNEALFGTRAALLDRVADLLEGER